MTVDQQERNELRDLLWSMEEGTISAEGIERIDRLVRSDTELLRFYVNYTQQMSDLRFAPHSHRVERVLSGLFSTNDLTSTIATEEPASWTAADVLHPLSNTLPASLQGTTGYFSSGWPVAYLVAAVIFGLGALIGAFTYVSNPSHVAPQSASLPSPHVPRPSADTGAVGRITGMVDCQWEGSGFRVQGSGDGTKDSPLIRLGDRFALKSGLLELTYNTGAKVILQGPVAYEVESPVGGYLAVGKLTARLDSHSEISNLKSQIPNQKSEIRSQKSPDLCPLTSDLFAIRTPTAIVTDLGTEFGVEVDGQGRTTSHVFRGTVRFLAVDANGAARGADLVLGKNESARVSAEADRRHASEAATRCDVAPDRFVRDMPRSIASLPIHVLAHFRLGDDDSNAVAGGPTQEQTMNRRGPWHLRKHGLPGYVGETQASSSLLAMNFTGTDGDYFYSDAFRWTPTDNFVLEAWVRVRRIGKEPMYVVYNGDSGLDGYGLMVWDGKWLFLLGGKTYGNSGATCEPGRWTHIALVCEGGKSQLWANGQPVGVPYSSGVNVPSRCFAIGGYREEGKTASHSLDGEVDEVRLFEFQAPFKPEMLLFQAPRNESSQTGKKTDGRSQADGRR